ncbi:serine hydrolase domain-containing protein [Azospirillum sp. SYSU D00513]|uniref:serine hydrolase domain-containing protein n=1 Tax=Azospirillum sp. SYSU D00513 TaxID=2812561 RepID=UPI001A96AFDE|nr:serine hydrolase domain-containing protein [Azospirillum sp. SYSU D00513]
MSFPSFLIDAVIDRAIDAGRIVGAVVLVARDGEVLHRRAAGLADREAGRPMREDALFRLASVTKPITSAAALALMERGRLGLDDPVRRWLPDFRPRLADGREPVLTVRHLMTHTAGLAYGFLEPDGGPYQRAGVSDGMDQPGLSFAENLRRIASVPLAYEPGTAWSYSVATDLLGAVLAEAAGMPLPDLVEELVTGPLGMVDTAFSVRDPARLAVPYGDAPDKVGAPVRMGEPHRVRHGQGHVRCSPARAFDPASFPSGGAGMTGGAGDVLRLLEALRRGGAPVLAPESVRALTTNAIGDLTVTTAAPGWGFGLGVAVLKDPRPSGTPQAAGTWRWGGVYGHSWFVDPAERLTVVSLTNTAVAGMTGAFPDALRNAVYGRA